MTKTKNLIGKITTLAIIAMFLFTIVSCKKKKVEISLTVEKDAIALGEKIKLDASVTGTDNTGFRWEISNPDIVTISYDNYLSVTKKVTTDEKVTITAISLADAKVTASKEVTVVAPKIEISIDKSSIKVNETANVVVNVLGLADKGFNLTMSENANDVVTLNENVLKVTKDVAFPISVTVTATSVYDNTIVSSATIDVVPADSDVVKMAITSTSDTVEFGGTITFTVTVTGTSNVGYTWEVSDPTLVKIENNTLSVLKEVTLDKLVKVTATSNANPNVFVSKSIIVKAPYVPGQVGELTSEMLETIGNSNITVSGVVRDIYIDVHQPANNKENSYDMEVKMNDGAWSGQWEVTGRPSTRISDDYRRGTANNVTDQNGVVGHSVERVYIDKNNQLAYKQIKDYMSIPTVWESQHLWNHLGQLNINKFQYDVENEAYEYIPEVDEYGQVTEDELYFLTYLAYSLTPMLEDTLEKVYLKVADGKITGLIAQTEVLLYGADTNEDPDAMSYTIVELTFSNIGTTIITNPEPYAAPENVDKLEAALTKIKNAQNYTFQANDVQTAAPSGDEGDYTVDSIAAPAIPLSIGNNPFVKAAADLKVRDYTSAVGTVGCYGQITRDAALYATTSKYSYTLDGKEYVTKYSGLKQNADETYDIFSYNSKLDALEGTKKVKGNIFDTLPQFDFSANIFDFVGTSISNGVTTYKFALKETSIIRDIALEISAYVYATDATATLDTNLEIVVDENGNLISTTYPYAFNQGTYAGYVTTVYSKIGTTELPASTFDGYVPRVLMNTWEEYMCKYYSANFSTTDSHDENAAVVLQSIFGDDYAKLPTPAMLLDVFGDNIFGPFYDWKSVGTDSNGNVINHGFITVTATSSDFDENAKINNYEEISQKLREVLEAAGYQYSNGNSDTSGGKLGLSDRYECYFNGNVEIVIQNNHTKYFWIYFYITGDWNLKK